MNVVFNASDTITITVRIAGDGCEVGVEFGANGVFESWARSFVLKTTWTRICASDCGIAGV
jgi:hypothetical protein